MRLREAADRERRRADRPGTPQSGGAASGELVDESDRQLITVMPLHAITAMYGEQGLRARFGAEITRLPDPGREAAAGRCGWLGSCTPTTAGSASRT